jgi:hypothetical protein
VRQANFLIIPLVQYEKRKLACRTLYIPNSLQPSPVTLSPKENVFYFIMGSNFSIAGTHFFLNVETLNYVSYNIKVIYKYVT